MSAKSSRARFGMLCALPATIMFLTFIVYPTIQVFRMSLYKWGGLSPKKTFVGLQNFEKLFVAADRRMVPGHGHGNLGRLRARSAPVTAAGPAHQPGAGLLRHAVLAGHLPGLAASGLVPGAARRAALPAGRRPHPGRAVVGHLPG